MKDYLLTVNHGLQLLSFPNLKPILQFQNDSGKNIGLNSYGSQNFLKSSDSRFNLIELVRLNGTNIGNFKMKQTFDVPNAVCCACPKNKIFSTMAIGLTDGTIALYDNEIQQRIAVMEPPKNEDHVFNCSKYLDFSSDHSKLVSVAEDGMIDVFNIHRKQLAYTIKEFRDDVPKLAKFSPNTDLNLLCIGFTSGKLKLYDTHAQKVAYKSKHKHFNVCKDLCFFKTKPNTVISIGYDSSVLIHDFRSEPSSSIHFLSDHILNIVTVSADDNYYCVGDYKGNLKVFDMRKCNFTPLSTAKISDRIINNIIFVRSSIKEFYDESNKVIESFSNKINVKSESTNEYYDSFFNFDITKLDDLPIPPLENNKTPTKNGDDFYEVKCENQFIKNIKSRSTCLFQQPNENELSSEVFVERSNKSSTLDNVPTSNSISSTADIMKRIDNYEKELKEMNSKMQGLKTIVGEMSKFIETFPTFLENEIKNLKQKYRDDDRLVVEKLSKMCAADPQIVELTNYMINRHSKYNKN